MNPRLLIIGLLLLLTKALLAQGVKDTSTAISAVQFDIAVKRLSPRVAVFYGDPWDNAIVALATQKGIVVIDAPFSKTIAQGFRNAIRKEFKRDDFAYLLNTHDHVCHVGGNEAFADIPIIGHESLRREMLNSMNDSMRAKNVCMIGEKELTDVQDYLRKNAPKKLQEHGYANYEKCWKLIQADYSGAPAVVVPTITFDREMTLFLGDVSVRLLYYGYTHGTADIVLIIPEENLILTGGIFYPDNVPILNKVTENATTSIVGNWFVVMHRLLSEANEGTQIIPSHHRAMMNKEQLLQFSSYVEEVWNKIRRAKASGKTLDQAKTEMPLKEFPNVAGLPNEKYRGSQWEILDIHQMNIDHLWKVLEK
jgi:glyoxylase-like metal-dependent hydrolase (beta-lactamase superfamily II)